MQALGALAQVGIDQQLPLTKLPAGVATLFGGDQLASFIGSYLNPQSNAARFEIVLADAPYSRAAMDTVDHLKSVLNRQGAVSGSTAVIADIRDYLRTDQRNTIAFVLAGIIVAGTFGAMMAGSILGLAQIGFAVSVGILIDTFVVRTILDPALASFFGRWTWWPGRVVSIPGASRGESREGAVVPDPGSAD